MVRVGISVEGTTEERFVQKSLVPYFALKDIFIQPVSMSGKVNLARVKNEIEKLAYNFDYVTTLYDFYGFKGADVNETKQSLEEKVKNSLKAEIQRKCVPYIQMYEFEGLLFSSPDIVGSVLGDDEYATWAQGVLDAFHGDPESINNSEQTAPSKRFNKNTPYRKTVHGPDIALQTGLQNIRDVCSGFDDWINKIELFALNLK